MVVGGAVDTGDAVLSSQGDALPVKTIYINSEIDIYVYSIYNINNWFMRTAVLDCTNITSCIYLFILLYDIELVY